MRDWINSHSENELKIIFCIIACIIILGIILVCIGWFRFISALFGALLGIAVMAGIDILADFVIDKMKHG